MADCGTSVDIAKQEIRHSLGLKSAFKASLSRDINPKLKSGKRAGDRAQWEVLAQHE